MGRARDVRIGGENERRYDRCWGGFGYETTGHGLALKTPTARPPGPKWAARIQARVPLGGDNGMRHDLSWACLGCWAIDNGVFPVYGCRATGCRIVPHWFRLRAGPSAGPQNGPREFGGLCASEGKTKGAMILVGSDWGTRTKKMMFSPTG